MNLDRYKSYFRLVGSLVNRSMRWIERISCSIFIIGALLRHYDYLQGKVLILISLSSLIITYLLRIFAQVSDPDAGPMHRLLDKIACLGWGISVLGILFYYFQWNGAGQFCLLGCFILFVIGIMYIVIKDKVIRLFTPEFVIRTTFYILVCFILIFFR